jgi:hypothetical protein
MLPSDHFVRMYNVLFIMLEEKGHGELQDYWLEIARLQDTIVGPYITKDGLKGMYDYWEHIRIEENCDADLMFNEDYFEFKMNKCPSLSKNLDNDAGQSELYCDHCSGWMEPIMNKYGYYLVYDMISRFEPRCTVRVYRDRNKAEEYTKGVKLLAKPYGDERKVP